MIDTIKEMVGVDRRFDSNLTCEYKLEVCKVNSGVTELEMAHARAILILNLILSRSVGRHIGMAAEQTAQQGHAVFRRAALQAIDVATKNLVCALPEEQNQSGDQEYLFEIGFHAAPSKLFKI